MIISEIFTSIQGETSFSGMPCLFIRTSGCNLRCNYCDTKYAYAGGEEISLETLEAFVKKSKVSLVSVTGGEPLLQDETYEFLKRIVGYDKIILLETNGSIGLEKVDKNVIKIVDVKCPSSGEKGSFLKSNLKQLRKNDELKFVISSRKDYEWAKYFIKKNKLIHQYKLLLSPVSGKLMPSTIARWILKDSLEVRLQLQLHRVIWPSRKRGV